MKADNSNNFIYNKKLQPLANQLRKSMTKSEACLWKYVLKSKRLKGYQFRRQRAVLDYIADFMCKELKLIIEVDGVSHDYDEIMLKDSKKQIALENAGFVILRFSDNEVLNDINNVIKTLEGWIDNYEIKNPPPAPASGGQFPQYS